MKALVSACLLGENCKYSGGNNRDPRVLEWLRETGCEAVPVCPEVLGGLPVPRTPAEIVDGAVTAKDGRNVDAAFRLGAALMRKRPDVSCKTSRRHAIFAPAHPACSKHGLIALSFTGAC